MRVADAARYFDKVLCADAYTPATTFYGQLDLFDDSKRDGVTVVRRVLSVAPDVTVPVRGVATFDGDYWILGSRHEDSFLGSAVRCKYVAQQATGLWSVQTAAQLLSTGGTAAYGGKLWVKDMKEVEVSSGMFSFYAVFFSASEVIVPGMFLTLASRVHRVRAVYSSAAGFLAAESSELATDALNAGVSYYPRGTGYSPVTEDVTESTPVVLNAVRMRFQDSFEYPNEAAPKFAEGDIKVVILKSAVATARVDDQIAFSDGRWRAIAVEDEDPCWGLHMRHA